MMGNKDKGICNSEKKKPKEENKRMENRGFESKGLLHTPKELFSPHPMHQGSLGNPSNSDGIYKINLNQLLWRAKNLLMSMVKIMRIIRFLRMSTFLKYLL